MTTEPISRDDAGAYRPPSESLRLEGPVWRPTKVSPVSYPDAGNDDCFTVEETSYWFRHRNHAIVAVIDLFRPSGPIFDIGGGNGFVSRAIERAGYTTVLVEPGSGALNAVRRGVSTVIQASLNDAEFAANSLDAVGVFDVVEHIEHSDAFIADLARLLTAGGYVYCTVPASPWLWSDDDAYGGHFRRYTAQALRMLFVNNGFDVLFLSHLFSWLHLPMLLCKALPYRLGLPLASRPRRTSARADHTLPHNLSAIVSHIHRWEISAIKAQQALPFGTSILCVARIRKPPL